MRRVFGKRLRPTDELLEDPALLFQVGRIVGAAEMASHWLGMQPDEQAQAMGARLAASLEFYYVPEKSTSVRVFRKGEREDETTVISPP